MTHASSRRLAAAAALDDLTPREHVRWAGHQAVCADCRGLEADIQSVLVELALATPGRVPPPSVLDGIRSAIRQGAGPA